MRRLAETNRANTAFGWIATRLPQRFLRREDGTVTIFAICMFILMIGIGGIAIDLMRFETQRVQLQYTLDRAVLAAASLTQELEPEDVVRGYFAVSGIDDYRLDVEVNEGINYRYVSAQAELDVQTFFMRMFGQRVLTSPAIGAAEERLPNIEVSMVLDISGSMRGYRMNRLRPAAREFVTTILEPNDNDYNENVVSVSIIPYNGTVNVGTTLSSVFSLTDEHTYSRCARFYDADFTVSGVDPNVPIQRLGHFDNDSYLEDYGRWRDPNWNIRCPTTDTGTAIIPWSHDEDEMHDLINDFDPEGWTASDLGMRWAMALLDPLARPALNGLVDAGYVHEDFRNRPASYSDTETVKVIVLMTDGANTRQFDLQDRYRSGPSPFWRDPDDGDFSIYSERWNAYWHESHNQWRSYPDGGGNLNAVQLDYADVWNYFPVREIQDELFNSEFSYAGWGGDALRQMSWDYDYWDIMQEYGTNGLADDRLEDICSIAQENGVEVFTIAFDAGYGGERVMRYCASSDANYYDVDGVDIDEAFNSIARAINELRLVQ